MEGRQVWDRPRCSVVLWLGQEELGWASCLMSFGFSLVLGRIISRKGSGRDRVHCRGNEAMGDSVGERTWAGELS